MRRFFITTVIGVIATFLLHTSAVFAQQDASETLSKIVKVDIPAQKISTALITLSHQAAVQVLIPGKLVDTPISTAVSGQMSLEEAISQLLKGTNLHFREVGENAIGIDVKQTDNGHNEITGALLAVTSPTRLAQTDAPKASAGASQNANASSEVKLEEIVVTAQRRREKLQEVPISAQIISGQTLTEQNHNSLDELAQTVPSVHVGTSIVSNDLFIRGVGSGQSAYFDQSVATFDDDIYHGRSRMSGATFLDLDRIEVLKGPQTTFFGNNAIAGALNIITKKPGDTFDASGRLLYGQFGQYAVEGAIGGPITDTLSVRVAVTRNGGSGWINMVNLGEKVPIFNNEAGRLTLVFKPTESLDATLKIEASKSTTSGIGSDQPLQWTNCPPPASFPPAVFAFAGVGCSLALAAGVPIGLNNNEATGLAGQGNHLSNSEDVLTINYHKWGLTFTSVSGLSNYHFDESVDGNNLPTDWNGTYSGPEHYDQFSQEFRMASPTGGPVEYLAGAYFQTDYLYDGFGVNGMGSTFWPLFGPAFNSLAAIPLASNGVGEQHERVYSAFGSLGWHPTVRLKLNVALRGNWTEKTQHQANAIGSADQIYGGFVPYTLTQAALAGQIFGPTCCNFSYKQDLSGSWRAWMPSGGIQYQLLPEAMAYFTYNRGFKAGGVNYANLFLPDQPLGYDAEYVNSYELGLKSKWLDDRLLLNLDVFRSDYRNLQVVAVIYIPATQSFGQEIRNAANSRSQGIEFETQWLVTKNFRLGTNITYLDTYYLSYPNSTPTLQEQALGIQVNDLSGQRLPYSPRWAGSVTASYGFSLSGDYKFTTQLSPYFSSSYPIFSDDPLVPGTGGYVRLDARLALERADGRWALDLIGKNLTNRIIVPNGGLFLASKEEPRNVALQIRYHW